MNAEAQGLNTEAQVMNTNVEKPKYGPDESDMKYWTRQGPRTAAFLLVIPGATLIGLGVGLLTNHLLPMAVIGFGLGLLLWGLIVALTP